MRQLSEVDTAPINFSEYDLKNLRFVIREVKLATSKYHASY